MYSYTQRRHRLGKVILSAALLLSWESTYLCGFLSPRQEESQTLFRKPSQHSRISPYRQDNFQSFDFKLDVTNKHDRACSSSPYPKPPTNPNGISHIYIYIFLSLLHSRVSTLHRSHQRDPYPSTQPRGRCAFSSDNLNYSDESLSNDSTEVPEAGAAV